MYLLAYIKYLLLVKQKFESQLFFTSFAKEPLVKKYGIVQESSAFSLKDLDMS